MKIRVALDFLPIIFIVRMQAGITLNEVMNITDIKFFIGIDRTLSTFSMTTNGLNDYCFYE